MNYFKSFKLKPLITGVCLPLLFLSCNEDDDDNVTPSSDTGGSNATVQIWNKFQLEDRTAANAGGAPTTTNGYAYMSANSENNKFYLKLNDFQNIGQAIALMPNGATLTADSFAIFITTAGAGLTTQNAYDEGDQPVHIGTLTSNGAQEIPLLVTNKPDAITLGGQTINTNQNVATNAGGYMTPQTSTGSRAIAYDWIVLHPYVGGVLRPTTYPGIVADLDKANDLGQNASPKARFTKVYPANDRVTIKNFGNGDLDISDYFLCTKAGSYKRVSAQMIVTGDLNLSFNEEVTLAYTIDEASADLALYTTNTFTVASAMSDFVQWGAGGQGRESVAVSKGIWTAGNFLTAPTTSLSFNGTISQYGQSHWTSN